MGTFQLDQFLKEVIENPGAQCCTFFAGAGISIDSGLPNFINFGRNMIGCIKGESDDVISQEDTDKLLYTLRPELLLQTISDVFGDNSAHFAEWLLGHTPNPAHRFLAHALTKGHMVITTNLDILIEKAYEELTGEKVRLVVEPGEFKALARELEREGRPLCATVMKPHGTVDIRFPATDPRHRYQSVRVCLDQVGQGLTPDCRTAVEHFISTTPMVFMGYSGCDHFSLTPVLCVSKTDQKAIWLFHDNQEEVVEDHEPIKKQYEDILKQVYCGKIYADINRGMELHAVCDILLSRKNIVQWKGNVSNLFKSVTGEQDFVRLPSIEFTAPGWTNDIQEYEKHLLACQLFKKAGLKLKSLEKANATLALIPEDEVKAKAKVLMILADIEMEKSTAEGYEKARTTLEEAKSLYEASEDKSGANDATLQIINVKRRQKLYKEALTDLQNLEQLLTDTQNYPGMRKHLTQIIQQKGLILGLCGDKEIEKKDKAVHLLKTGVEYSDQNGYVLLKSSCLNALALVIGVGSNDLEKLQQGEQALYDALDLNVYCGQTRSCFQQYRNLGLIHFKLATLNEDPSEKQSLFEKALNDYENAEKFLARNTSGFLEGEMLEAKFRQGEALVKLGRDEEALQLMQYVISRRKVSKDWHNEARAVDVILQTTLDSVYGQYMGHLLDIYRGVLRSEEKRLAFKKQAFKLANAKDFFKNAIEKAKENDLTGIAQDLVSCIAKVSEI